MATIVTVERAAIVVEVGGRVVDAQVERAAGGGL